MKTLTNSSVILLDELRLGAIASGGFIWIQKEFKLLPNPDKIQPQVLDANPFCARLDELKIVIRLSYKRKEEQDMKKFWLATLGIIAALVVLANLGSLLALTVSALIAYAGFHYFRKSESTFKKFFWGVVLLIGLLTGISNVPAFIGIIALVGVFYVWKKWNGVEKDSIISDSNDPFDNFERQWNELTK